MFNENKLNDLLVLAERAVDRAVSLLDTFSACDLHLTFKGERDYASELDFKIEQELRGFLLDAEPEIGFLGEEYGGDSLGNGAAWVLDPIDGTVNFVRGIPLFGVSLALLHNGKALVSVIDFPALGQRYTATCKSFTKLDGQRIQVSSVKKIEESIVGFGDFSVGDKYEEKNVIRIHSMARFAQKALRCRMLGSAALQMCWVAAGYLDMALTFSNNIWDVQGGVLVVRQAGGEVFDSDGADHAVCSKYTFASNADLKSKCLQEINESNMFEAAERAG
ncbi:MAG: inositol monophosphatase [Planctomycetes bacterium]|nr:inositol monophosphatase [Planctomycetota bacterium]